MQCAVCSAPARRGVGVHAALFHASRPIQVDRDAARSALNASGGDLKRAGRQLLQKAMNTAEQKKQVGPDENSCVVCMDARAEYLFVGCGHVCACGQCATQLDACPACRKASATTRVFFVSS